MCQLVWDRYLQGDPAKDKGRCPDGEARHTRHNGKEYSGREPYEMDVLLLTLAACDRHAPSIVAEDCPKEPTPDTEIRPYWLQCIFSFQWRAVRT